MTNRPIVHKPETTTLPATEAFFGQSLFQSLFWKPRRLTENPAGLHLPFLFWLVAAHKPNRLTVIGCGDGAAYFGLCQALDKTSLSAHATGFCFPDGLDGTGIPAPLSEHEEMLYSDLSRLEARASPAEAIGAIPAGSCDLLFIDLDALPEGATLSEGEIGDCLSPTGILLLHGTNGTKGGVLDDGAMTRLLRNARHLEFTAGHGLTMILRGDTASSPIQSLLDSSDHGAPARDVELAFRKIGDGLQQEAQSRARLAQISALETALTVARADHAALREAAAAQDAKLHEVQAELAERVKAHEDLSRRLQDLDYLTAEVARLRAALATAEETEQKERDKRFQETAALTRHAEDLRSKLAASEQAVRSGSGNGSLKAEVTALKSALAQAENGLAEERSRRFEETTGLTQIAEQHLGQITILEFERDLLRADKARLEQWINDLWSSKSWKITAPLRSVRKVFGTPER